MSEGVPVSKLRCPTCRSLFHLTVKREEDDSAFSYGPGRVFLDGKFIGHSVVTQEVPHLECHAGHKWSLKVLIRDGREDAVLLDRWIGGGDYYDNGV